MEKQVLSIKQMLELTALGIDTSKASIFWEHKEFGVYEVSTSPYAYNNPIPTFTLQDILEMLPNTIEWKGETYWFSIFVNCRGDKMIGYRDLKLWPIQLKPFNIYGAFYMLKWCKQNGI